MAASIKDVAKKAGVSAGTVSRAFNDYPDIKPETRQRILSIASELGYMPILSAKNLSAKKSSNMAIIFNGLLFEQNDFYVKSDGKVIRKPSSNGIRGEDSGVLIMRGACQYAMERNLEMPVYAYSSQIQAKKTYDQFCREHRLSGALVFGLKTTDTYYEALQHSTLPCVTIDTKVVGENIGYVGSNNIASFKELTQYLFDRGHREIVMLNGYKVATVCLERLAGAYEAFQENGLELKSENVLYTDFREDVTERLVMGYLEKYGKTKATAFLCVGDMIGVAALRAIRRAGYSVPDDFSVASYDGFYIGEYMQPGLTTIDQDLEAKGYAAAKLLHDMVLGKTTAKNILMPYKLLERGSVGRIDRAK